MNEDKKTATPCGKCPECGEPLCCNCGKCCKCGECDCKTCHPEEKDNEPTIEEPINYS